MIRCFADGLNRIFPHEDFDKLILNNNYDRKIIQKAYIARI